MSELEKYKDINYAIETINDIIENPPIGEDDEIEVLNKLNSIGHMSAWAIGKIITRRDELIKINYEAWANKKGKTAESRPPDSLKEYFLRNQEAGKLRMSYKTAMECKRVFESTDRFTAEQLGKSKVIEINKAPKQLQPQLYEVALEQNLKLDEIRKEVEKANQKEEKKIIFETEVRPNLPDYSIKIEQRKAIVTTKNNDLRDAFIETIQDMELPIKKKMFDRLNR